MNNESLGIPNYGPWYLYLNPNQKTEEEFNNINKFIIETINTIPEFEGNKKQIKFINYGRTQLVFVLTIDDTKRYTLLVNQPSTTFNQGKQEYDNLIKLSNMHPNNIIKPIKYIAKDNKYELYITPYEYQSRCIGVCTNNWGVWIPEPVYHFKEFTKEERTIINTTLVSQIIKYYNETTNTGISKIRLDGGDFMLKKGYENNPINYENIINNLKLIAARELIHMPLNEYIENLRNELSSNNSIITNKLEILTKEDINLIITIALNNDTNIISKNNIILGKKIKNPFTKEEIENGIELGLTLRKTKKTEN